MSRHFELLQRAERDRELFGDIAWPSANLPATAPASKPAAAAKAKPAGPGLDAVVRDEVAKLVQRLFLLSANGSGPRTVLFTGIEHGDGSSWICARASQMAATQLAGSVCVVDANFRAPTLHEHFGVPNDRGLADAAVAPGRVRDFARRLEDGNLWFMPCGSSVSDLAMLLSSDRLRVRLAELRTEFDRVLIDAPPVGIYSDAAVLGQLADGVVLVVGANSARRETARRAKESLAAAKVRVLGAVLNKRTFPIPEALYRRL